MPNYPISRLSPGRNFRRTTVHNLYHFASLTNFVVIQGHRTYLVARGYPIRNWVASGILTCCANLRTGTPNKKCAQWSVRTDFVYSDVQKSVPVKLARLLSYITIGCCFDSHPRIDSVLQRSGFRYGLLENAIYRYIP
jgi:hypothetical protein